MRRYLFLVAAALMSAEALAAPVTAPEAVAYAVAYWRNVRGRAGIVDRVDTVTLSGVDVCYRVAWHGGGWTLVAADDALEPVIGFSETGEFSVRDVCPPLRGYLSGVAARIAAGGGRSAHWATDTVASKNKSAEAEVEPLIKVEWNQTGEYQEYCPEKSGKKAMVGCVAVALGQAMSVYQKPERPSGYHSYSCEGFGRLSVNYDEEEPYDWDAIMNAQHDTTDRKECGRLLYHLGVAVDMTYSVDGSGAWPRAIPSAMKTYFGYTNKMKRVIKEGYSDDEWAALLIGELREGRPLVYSGYDDDDNGHCFNIDGYMNDGDGDYKFHFNWGWAGSGNGYFTLSRQTYKNSQESIIGLTPATGEPEAISISSKEVSCGAKAGTVVATISIESDDDNAEWAITASSTALPLPGKEAPFYFGTDGNKLIVSQDIPESVSAGRKLEVRITAENTETGSSMAKTFNISVTEPSSDSLPGITADDGQGVLYTLDGRRVGTTDDAAPRPGVYIFRQQNSAKKLLIR